MTISPADFYRTTVSDADPDLSYLGEYSDTPAAVHIDRAERGDMNRREYRYFNAGAGDPDYIESDYARYERYNAGGWHMIAVRAAVDLDIPCKAGGTISQTIVSPGVWGIESDSAEGYVDDVFADECQQLSEMLEAMGLTVVDDSGPSDSEGGDDATA